MTPLFTRISQFLGAFELKSSGKWFLLSGLIGVVSGLGAVIFQLLMQVVAHFTLCHFAGYVPEEAAGEHIYFQSSTGDFTPWILVVVMAAGGLISGLIVYTFAPEAEGHGTDAAIDAFHNKRGFIRGRIPLIKTIASAITIGTGGSGGREGPIAQIGAGFGSYVATRLGLSARDRRIMMAAGMGAGIGAIFRAPLAGALFAGEILYRDADLESDAIVPSAISSIIAYSVFCFSLPQQKWFSPLFGSHFDYSLVSPLELIPFGLLSIVLVLAAILYIKVFHGVHAVFRRIPLPLHVRPAIGATLAGLFAVGVYFWGGSDLRLLAILSTGYGSLQEALHPSGSLTIGVLLAVALGKIVTTSLTISSGGSGGVFGPSMVIGGCLGAAVGLYFHTNWPNIVPQPQSYAIVGMAGFFAGCANAPLSTIIMVSELTGDYKLLLPTMWVSTICFLLCRRWSLYTKQVRSRLESPAHRGDFIVDVLEGIKVADVFDPKRKIRLIPEGMSLEEIVHALAHTHQQYFPVSDARGRMVGIFSSNDVRSYLFDQTIWQLAVARDIMVTNVVSVTPEDDLNVALRRFTSLNLDELPVLDPSDPGHLLGMLRRKETIAFYNQRLMEHKQAQTD